MSIATVKIHLLLNDVHGTWHYFNKEVPERKFADDVFLYCLTEGNFIKNDNFERIEAVFNNHVIVEDIDNYFNTFKLEFLFDNRDEIFIGTVHSYDTSDELQKDEVEYLWIQSLEDKDYFIYWLGDPIIKRQLEIEHQNKKHDSET